MSSVNTKTKNANLQTALNSWVEMIQTALAETNPSTARNEKVLAFVRTFVPLDVTEDDIDHFSNNLITDEEFFASLLRDVRCCATGNLVEEIQGNQTTNAIFTILPDPGTVSEGSSLDIVREVAYISTDRGATWRAEA